MDETNDGWYGGGDCADPEEVAPRSRWMAIPKMDGSIGGYRDHPLPPMKSDCTHCLGQGLLRWVVYPHAPRNVQSEHPAITEEEHRSHQVASR